MQLLARLSETGCGPHIDDDGDLAYYGDPPPELSDVAVVMYWPLVSALGGPLCWPDPVGTDGRECRGPDPTAPPGSRLWCGALDPAKLLPHNIRAIMPTGHPHQPIGPDVRERWPELFDDPPEKKQTKAQKRWNRELTATEALFS